MLAFQAALDPHHSIFRALRIAAGFADILPVEIDKFRIADFYLSFPFRLGGFEYRRGQGELKRIAQEYENRRPYGGFPDDRDLFLRMRPVQSAAIETLAARGVFDPDALKQGKILRGDVAPPDELMERVLVANAAEPDLVALLAKLSLSNPLLGQDGLKKRSNLMDYRYDIS
jgi:hypothetical protein